jgi:hypothetical protein
MQCASGVPGLREALLRASAEVDAGNFVDDEVVRDELRARFAGQIPDDLLAELVRE